MINFKIVAIDDYVHDIVQTSGKIGYVICEAIFKIFKISYACNMVGYSIFCALVFYAAQLDNRNYRDCNKKSAKQSYKQYIRAILGDLVCCVYKIAVYIGLAYFCSLGFYCRH